VRDRAAQPGSWRGTINMWRQLLGAFHSAPHSDGPL